MPHISDVLFHNEKRIKGKMDNQVQVVAVSRISRFSRAIKLLLQKLTSFLSALCIHQFILKKGLYYLNLTLHLIQQDAYTYSIQMTTADIQNTGQQLVVVGLPLCLAPSTSYSIHFFTQLLSSLHSTCPYYRNLFFCSTKIMSPNPAVYTHC